LSASELAVRWGRWSVRNGASIAASGRNLPLGVAATWWVLCFALYAAAWPIAYTHRNILGVSALMAGTLIAAIIGYRRAVGIESLAPQTVLWKIPLPVLIGFIASLILVVPLIQTYSGFGVFDLGMALKDQAAAYAQASQRIAEGFDKRRGIVVLETLLAPFTLSVIPFLALSWFEARKHGLLLLLGLAAPIYVGLLEGRSVAIGTAGILVFGAWIISRVRRHMPLRWFEIVTFATLGVAGLAAFGAQKLARYGVSPICPPGTNICTGRNPSLIEGTWVIFASYASQGLEGLGRALDAVWTFGGGFSHSIALESMLARLFHFQPPAVVTLQLPNVGWSDTTYWSTALTSIANDVPWPLVPLVIGVHAAILGSSWRSAVEHADWLSVTVFCYTWIDLLFIPQNLQLAISGPVYVGYIALLAWYLARSVRGRHLHTIRSVAARLRDRGHPQSHERVDTTRLGE
jgi:hypothetical protein